MSLIDSINQHNERPRGLASVNAKLTAAQQSELRVALSDAAIGHTAIARALKDHGVDVTEATVRRWRDRTSTVDGL